MAGLAFSVDTCFWWVLLGKHKANRQKTKRTELHANLPLRDPAERGGLCPNMLSTKLGVSSFQGGFNRRVPGNLLGIPSRALFLAGRLRKLHPSMTKNPVTSREFSHPGSHSTDRTGATQPGTGKIQFEETKPMFCLQGVIGSKRDLNANSQPPKVQEAEVKLSTPSCNPHNLYPLENLSELAIPAITFDVHSSR